MQKAKVVNQIAAEARTADQLHERSRSLLVNAVRAGAAAGLSQREIATAVNRSQPEVSRLLRFHGTSELGRRLVRNRKRVLDLAGSYGVRNIRVFGSVARGTEGPDSDVDLLAEVPRRTSLFDMARLELDLGELLGTKVDVMPDNRLRENLADRLLAEAVPL